VCPDAAYDLRLMSLPTAGSYDEPVRRGWQCLLDAVLAAALALASVASFTGGPWRAASAAVIVAGLLVQHCWPLPALALTSAGAAVQLFYSWGDPRPICLGPVIALYVLTAQAQKRRIPAAALAVLLTTAYLLSLHGVSRVVDPVIHAKTPEQAEAIRAKLAGSPPREPNLVITAFREALSIMLVLVLAFAIATAVRARLAQLDTLRQRAADLEREQHQREELAAAAERARLSRELHDVVAHSLTVMVAQAQAAVAAQRRHPERTTEALHEVINVGRGSLTEMRRLLNAFRNDPESHPGLAPQSGVDDLPSLVDRVRAAGTPVRLEVDGEPAPLPAGVDLSAYRIIQEALTNTLKHAGPGASAAVHLAFRPGRLEIEVTDDGAGRPAQPVTGRGNGLRGIAERVGLLGGELTVGPAPERGFQVRARLPIEQVGATA
jgi:signal transduction histidine kinase